jgi:hypothetical protein
MLEKILHIATFGAFLVIAGFIGVFLLQSLFVAEKIGDSHTQADAEQAEQKSANKHFDRGGAIPSERNTTDRVIANYTKCLAIFTAFLVLATIGLFVSGERSIEISRGTAVAAKDSATAAQKAANLAEETLIATNRPWISITAKVGPRGLYFNENGINLQVLFFVEEFWKESRNRGHDRGCPAAQC